MYAHGTATVSGRCHRPGKTPARRSIIAVIVRYRTSPEDKLVGVGGSRTLLNSSRGVVGAGVTGPDDARATRRVLRLAVAGRPRLSSRLSPSAGKPSGW